MPIDEALYEKTAELVRRKSIPEIPGGRQAFRLQIGGEIAARALRESVAAGGVGK